MVCMCVGLSVYDKINIRAHNLVFRVESDL